MKNMQMQLRNPHMYGWINEENNFIESISVKKKNLGDPANGPLSWWYIYALEIMKF